MAKHHPWDDGALAGFREVLPQKTIKTACGVRVKLGDCAEAEAGVDCPKCLAWIAERDRGHALIMADVAERAAKACTCSGAETGAEHSDFCAQHVEHAEPPREPTSEYDFGVRAVQLLSQVFAEFELHYVKNTHVEDGHVEVDRMLGVTWGDDFGPFEVYAVTHWPGVRYRSDGSGEPDSVDVTTIGEPHQRFDAAICALARELATMRITHFQDREADAEAAEAHEAARAEKGRNRW